MTITSSKPTVLLQRFWEVRNDFESDELIAFSINRKHFATEVAAHNALMGLLQWLTCHLEQDQTTVPMVMFRSSVACMFDVMNEFGSYENFCKMHLGLKIIRHNVNVEALNDLYKQNASTLTLTRLDVAYGNDTVRTLQDWMIDIRPPQILFYTTTQKLA